MKVENSRSVVLASASPRRLSLLQSAGFDIEVVAPELDEVWRHGEEPAVGVRSLAQQKLNAVLSASAHRFQRPTLAADTVVVVDHAVLGKPSDAAAARRMLAMLSGRGHQVMTGFAIAWPDGRQHVETVVTDVRFRPLSGLEIDRYIDTGEPFDKAGAYGIQGLGGALVARVEGSYTNVVGLPLCEVLAALASSEVVA